MLSCQIRKTDFAFGAVNIKLLPQLYLYHIYTAQKEAYLDQRLQNIPSNTSKCL